MNLINFTDVTNVAGTLMYWVKFNQNKYKFIHESQIKEKWPLIGINFLEQRLQVETIVPDPDHADQMGMFYEQYCYIIHFKQIHDLISVFL